MPSDRSKPVTLRRSCQACAKGKRRCDQGWPRCSRCASKGVDCEYINMPFAVGDSRRLLLGQRMGPKRSMAKTPPMPQIPATLGLEIAKEYDPNIIRFLVGGLRNLPFEFATSRKTLFIHPGLYTSGLPTPVREVHDVCKLSMHHYSNGENSSTMISMFRQHSMELFGRLNHSANFEELLGCSQALVLIQCILALNDTGTTGPFSEATSSMLAGIAMKLWQQAPIQLPQALSPRQAWLLAESVRRTIIVCFMLRSAYSLSKRNYSVRTPFVDSLPFDLRTNLWDDDSSTSWEHALSDSNNFMVSLHEWSDSMAAGRVHDVSHFSGLILAACKGQAVSIIPSPPLED